MDAPRPKKIAAASLDAANTSICWPPASSIKFENVTAHRYAYALPFCFIALLLILLQWLFSPGRATCSGQYQCVDPRQENIGIIGDIASGKTAFLSAVLGLVEYNGRNTVDDTDVRELPDVFVQQCIVSVSPLPARVSGHAAPEPRPPLYGTRAQNCLPDDIVVEVLKKLILWREVVARGATLDSPMSAMGLSRDREVLSIARAILRQKHLGAKIVMVGGTLSTVDPTLDLLASRGVPRMHPQQGDASPRDARRRFTGNQASQRLY
ncbi:hypothetical protein BBO_08831 [Beauveria brongniartii RCEF 3172]|uniref:Uncharacterized protein n=1 Tax=Beauveria brongniartii RCEF 3172 TaxID=1081107 RepID=A0A166WYF5_9HYPO|nr:hypothetical protein BBO_08831 [Beauveria brongniartii RCEF 3172]